VKRKKNSLEKNAETLYDVPATLPLLPIETISTNCTNLFAHMFNLIPSGIHTFSSVSPSLDEISFSVNKTGGDIFWNDSFDEFMESLVCRLALTGQAILTATSFTEENLGKKTTGNIVTIDIMGWHIAGDGSKITPFDHRMMKKWYSNHGISRPGMRNNFHNAYPL
jgi:hypothetical protein